MVRGSEARRRGRMVDAIRLVGAVLTVMASAGCRPETTAAIAAPPTVEPKRSLENGVRVMEYQGDAFDRAPRWKIDSQPLAILAGKNRKVGVEDIRSVVPLSDGRYFVLHRHSTYILLFSTRGDLEKAYGGPAQFSHPTSMFPIRGDTVLVTDRAERISWLTADRGVVKTDTLFSHERLYHMSEVGRFSDGRALALALVRTDSTTLPIVRHVDTVLIAGVRGDGVRGAGSVLAEEERLPSPDDIPGTKYTLGFSQRAIAVPWDTEVVVSGPSGYRIEIMSDAGAPQMSIRVGRARRAVTPEMQEAAIEYELSRYPGIADPGHRSGRHHIRGKERRQYEAWIRNQRFSDSVPPFDLFATTPDGYLWVTDGWAPSDHGWAATRFDREGRMSGRLVAPFRGRAVAFARDKVIVLIPDEDGGQRLAVYRIRPAD